MDLNQYQQLCARTMAKPTDEVFELTNNESQQIVFLLGLAGEAGEVCDYMKKVIGHGHPMEPNKLKKELGDVLWYVSALATTFGMTLEEVAEANIEKLKIRYPQGFTVEDSLARRDAFSINENEAALAQGFEYEIAEAQRYDD